MQLIHRSEGWAMGFDNCCYWLLEALDHMHAHTPSPTVAICTYHSPTCFAVPLFTHHLVVAVPSLALFQKPPPDCALPFACHHHDEPSDLAGQSPGHPKLHWSMTHPQPQYIGESMSVLFLYCRPVLTSVQTQSGKHEKYGVMGGKEASNNTGKSISCSARAGLRLCSSPLTISATCSRRGTTPSALVPVPLVSCSHLPHLPF